MLKELICYVLIYVDVDSITVCILFLLRDLFVKVIIFSQCAITVMKLMH